jgi:hypothetical protein
LDLELFFPFASVSLSTVALEPNDVAVTVPSPDGTKVQLMLNTNSTDVDIVGINIPTAPELVFIKKSSYITEGSADLPIYLNDVKITDSIGSGGAVSGLNNYCGYQQQALLVKPDENLLAKFEVLAW